MRRERRQPRANWRERCEDAGFSFHSMDGVYWDESACYAFTAEQIDTLEAATEELHQMCLQAVGHALTHKRLAELAVPEAFHDFVLQSWTESHASLYGRFDFSWDGSGAPKLLEYNADTPTSLIEASVVQWHWLQDVHPRRDQFNSLHEKLIDRWKELRPEMPDRVHFGCVTDNEEDLGNLEYLRDTAIQAGLDTQPVAMSEIGWSADARCFVDRDNAAIAALFKLYPWEWLVREAFAPNLLQGNCRYIEPPWKMLLSNKAMLAILWELFPDHPNLLPCYFSPDRLGREYVRKPIYSREGANVSLRRAAGAVSQFGSYGAEGYVYQAFAPLPEFEGNFAVIGSWIVGEAAAGIGIREDDSLITKNTSRFLPHYFT